MLCKCCAEPSLLLVVVADNNGCVSGCSLLVFLTADNSTLNTPSFRDSRHIQPVFLLPRSSFQLYSCGAQSGQA